MIILVHVFGVSLVDLLAVVQSDPVETYESVTNCLHYRIACVQRKGSAKVAHFDADVVRPFTSS